MNYCKKTTSKAAFTKKQQLKKQLILFIITVMILFISCAFFGNILTSAQDKSDKYTSKDCYKSIAIQYGDTLWSIAEEYITDDYSSVQDYVKHLKKINDLKSDELEAGKYLIVTYERNLESAKSNP